MRTIVSRIRATEQRSPYVRIGTKKKQSVLLNDPGAIRSRAAQVEPGPLGSFYFSVSDFNFLLLVDKDRFKPYGGNKTFRFQYLIEILGDDMERHG